MRRSLGRGLSQLLSSSFSPPPAVEKTPPKPAAKPLPKVKQRVKASAPVQTTPAAKPTPAPKLPTVATPAPPVRKVEEPEAVSSSHTNGSSLPRPNTSIPMLSAEPGPALVRIADIVPNAQQPRTHFEETALQELAASIREVGILQPILLKEIEEGRYEIIAGERRWRAAKLAGLERVPAVIRKESHRGSLELALIENLQREDIGPLEAARAYQRLLDEFDMTQESVAQRVGKSRSAVANSVRLLRLPERVQQGIEQGLISEGHARALLAVEDATLQLALFEKIVADGLSVRETEVAVRPGAPTKASGPQAKQSKQLHPSLESIRSSLSERLGAPVKFQGSGKRGKLVIEFYSEDDLDRILETIGVRID